MTTHYDILGVSNDSSSEEIKKAFRKLSLVHHPDRNPTSDTTEKFQEISHAYEVLGNDETRKEYDAELMYGKTGGNRFEHSAAAEFQDINNLFNMLFSGGGGMHHGFPGMHQGFPGMMSGGPNIRIFHNGVQVNQQMFVQKPETLVKTIIIDIKDAYTGVSLPIEIEKVLVKNGIQSTEIDTVYVDVFKGIDNNDSIVLPEKGHSVNDVCGDLKIVVQVSNTSSFQRSGLDLTFKKSVTLKEALCGFSFEILHLNGKRILLNNTNNPTVIKPNFRKVVANMGMERNGSIGNMNIDFEVEFPDILTTEQIKSLQDIL